MSKLRTPFIYEDKIRGLNDVGVLTLSDEIQQVIEAPVCDKRPVDSLGIAAGRFLRGSEVAVLAEPDGKGFKNYQYFEQSTNWLNPYGYYTFAQKVSQVLIVPIATGDMAAGWWCDFSGTAEYKAISKTETTLLDFTGVELFVYITSPGIGQLVNMGYYGFY